MLTFLLIFAAQAEATDENSEWSLVGVYDSTAVSGMLINPEEEPPPEEPVGDKNENW